MISVPIMPVVVRYLLSVALALTSLGIGTGSAQPVFEKQVYFPGTQSYFELVRAPVGRSIRGPNLREITWENAQITASERTFKGVRGRLAVVKSAALNSFLLRTFKPYDSLIGLRYYCAHHRLVWVDGEEHLPTAYSNWTTPWKRGVVCTGYGIYGAVFMTPRGQWTVEGERKEFYAFFVEYPTGGP